jgi:hypothetical protein
MSLSKHGLLNPNNGLVKGPVRAVNRIFPKEVVMTAKASRKSSPTTIYQLKVTLHDSKPPIWRRIEVADTTTLAKLHNILQIIMGWTDSHLHQFVVNHQFYSDPTFELDDVANEQRISLQRLALQPKMRFGYEYDFGDYWQHDILVEKEFPPEPDTLYPRCVKGKLACPPEDCGGIWGYYQLLEAIHNPQHPDHQDMLEWLGDNFDPDAFDLASINRQLHALK